jgi:uncharacterized protein
VPVVEPPRVVIDTNIVVNALFGRFRNRNSDERYLLDLVISGDPDAPQLLLSEAIFKEYEDVLHRAHFYKRYPFKLEVVDDVIAALASVADWIEPWSIADLADPDDNCFYECAIDGNADYLITRNLRHFPNEDWIVSAREFWESEEAEEEE